MPLAKTKQICQIKFFESSKIDHLYLQKFFFLLIFEKKLSKIKYSYIIFEYCKNDFIKTLDIYLTK